MKFLINGSETEFPENISELLFERLSEQHPTLTKRNVSKLDLALHFDFSATSEGNDFWWLAIYRKDYTLFDSTHPNRVKADGRTDIRLTSCANLIEGNKIVIRRKPGIWSDKLGGKKPFSLNYPYTCTVSKIERVVQGSEKGVVILTTDDYGFYLSDQNDQTTVNFIF